jgi:hypothetical protein
MLSVPSKVPNVPHVHPKPTWHGTWRHSGKHLQKPPLNSIIIHLTSSLSSPPSSPCSCLSFPRATPVRVLLILHLPRSTSDPASLVLKPAKRQTTTIDRAKKGGKARFGGGEDQSIGGGAQCGLPIHGSGMARQGAWPSRSSSHSV